MSRPSEHIGAASETETDPPPIGKPGAGLTGRGCVGWTARVGNEGKEALVSGTTVGIFGRDSEIEFREQGLIEVRRGFRKWDYLIWVGSQRLAAVAELHDTGEQ